jgi:hypothetical protein
MKTNVGQADRLLRLVAGVAIIAAGAYYQSWWGTIGIAPIATALLRWCPGYALLGIGTCPLSGKN